MKKVMLALGTLLAWAATVFTYKLPYLGIAHASPEEAQPFVIAFAGLAVTMTALWVKTLASEQAVSG